MWCDPLNYRGAFNIWHLFKYKSADMGLILFCWKEIVTLIMHARAKNVITFLSVYTLYQIEINHILKA